MGQDLLDNPKSSQKKTIRIRWTLRGDSMNDGRRAATSFADVGAPGEGVYTRNVLRSRSRNLFGSVWLVGVTLAFLGCAGAPQQKGAFDPQLADNVNTAASQAAVAKPGTKVCRWVQVGIAERDLISGVVQQAQGNQLQVRIDDPGRFPKSVNGHQVAKGELLSDAATAWTPCKT
jgi:hypothetical protein